LNKIDTRQAIAIIEKKNIQNGSLIPILQDLQEEYGYLTDEIIDILSKRLNIPISNIIGTATFYSQFRFKPVGKHIIKVCHGTACHISGASKLSDALKRDLAIDEGETTEDGMFTLNVVACLGCCSLAPVMMVDSTAYGRLTPNKIKRIIQEYRKRG